MSLSTNACTNETSTLDKLFRKPRGPLSTMLLTGPTSVFYFSYLPVLRTSETAHRTKADARGKTNPSENWLP